MPNLSVVMPVYNEAAVIRDVISDLVAEVTPRIDDFEVVVVDDASTDETPAILDRLAAENPRVKVHHSARNRGHGPALRAAFDASTAPWVLQMDSDGRQVPSDLWLLWERRERADLVMGARRMDRNSRHRVVVSAGARSISRLLAGSNLRDVNVPFKLMRRALWDDVSAGMPEHPMVPSLLVTVGAAVRGWRIEQVPVTHRDRGRPSTLDVPRLARLCFAAVSEVLTYRVRLARRGVRGQRPGDEPAAAGP